MWERELKIIDSLGKLYPEFGVAGYAVKYKNYQDNSLKAHWVRRLCEFHLKQRIPRLEEFINENNSWAWGWYKGWFDITDEQCGKEN